MTGLVGGEATGGDLDAMADRLWSEPWYASERFEADGHGLDVRHHGERDPGGTTVWRDGRRAGVVHGAITNRDAPEGAELFERVLSDPASILPDLDGPFALAAVDADADRAVIATDKLCTRRIHYTDDGPLLFGTNVGAILEGVDEPTVDHRGICDLLTLGATWGDRTLVEDVRSLPTASVLEYEDGERSVTQYWLPEFDPSEREFEPFASGAVERFQDAVDATADTVEGTPGVWLSGGLDSRALAAALASSRDRVDTYSYDANPGDGSNPALARQVADRLDLPYRTVDLEPDGFLDVLEEGVAITDGLISWKTFLNVSASFALPDDATVMFEGIVQSDPLGNAIWQEDVQGNRSPAEALYTADHYLDRERVQELLVPEVDPMQTYREETDIDGVSGFLPRVSCARLRNHSRGVDSTSNQLARTRVGTRTHVVDGDYLSHAARTPFSLWQRAVPFSGGRVPYGTCRMKLELVRAYDAGLDQIPYQRTGVPPARPLWQHAGGFVATTIRNRLQDKPAPGGRSLSGEWYRRHPGLRSRVDGLLADACDRELFDADALRELQHDHLEGAHQNIRAISCVTTAELWFQQFVDG